MLHKLKFNKMHSQHSKVACLAKIPNLYIKKKIAETICISQFHSRMRNQTKRHCNKHITHILNSTNKLKLGE